MTVYQLSAIDLSGEFFIGDPAVLFDSEEEWLEFSQLKDGLHVQEYKGLSLCLVGTFADGFFRIYDEQFEDPELVDVLPIDTALIVIAPVEIASTSRDISEFGLVVSTVGKIPIHFEVEDGLLQSIFVAGLYLPIDAELRGDLEAKEVEHESLMRQKQQEEERRIAMEKALKKRRKK
jgi:hypothetical protein